MTGARRPGGPLTPTHARMLETNTIFRATPEQAAEIQARLEAIAELCERAGDDGEKEFGVTLVFYASPPATTRRRKQ